MGVTVRDIARRVNVSHAMVSRALSGNSKSIVAPQKRDMILKAAEELGYRPNHAARTLATGQSRVIALQVYDIENAHEQRVARRFGELVGAENYDLVIHGFGSDSLRMRWSIDGTIINGRNDYQAYPEIDLQSPVVAIGPYPSGNVDTVFVDIKSGADEAMAHLIESGRRRILLMTMDEKSLDDGRTAAYVEAMNSANLPRLTYHLTRNSLLDGRAAMAQYLRNNDAPDVILCQNDQTAAGCYRALHDAGLSIPRDVAVVGCDGLDQNDCLCPSLSSIEQPVAETCKIAWEMLQRRMADPSIERQFAEFKTRFVLRESC